MDKKESLDSKRKYLYILKNMQNQSSPVQILSPVIPSNWCPEGSWSDVFNSYNQLFLNNSTVNIPGLGLVTPQQIATINQNIQNLQNEYDALAVNVRTGTQSVGSGPNSFTYTISFSSPMPNNTYSIIIEPQTSSTSAGANWSWAIIAGTKTTTGFQVLFYNGTGTVVTGFNWTAQSISST
jgi:hypothetical protein